MSKSIWNQSAVKLATKLQTGDVSATEVLKAHLERVEQVNPVVNAIVSMDTERAYKHAKEADERYVKDRSSVGPLHGFPLAIKDNISAEGFPTTFGFSPFKDNIAKQDDLVVDRLRKAGGIVFGKTNIPEFAAGAHTFNELFGVTKNPYNLEKTAGGSSGGAAVGVTTGMLPFADGSDMGGSLRFPAAFNNVVGLRTSPGRIPFYPRTALYSTLAVLGPIARSVTDAAFMLSVMAGPDSRSPLSIAESGESFLKPFTGDIKGLRVAFSKDLGGVIPVDSEIADNVRAQAAVFEKLGCHVEEACFDLTETDDVFRTLRAWEFEMSNRELVDQYKNEMKPSYIANFEQGQKLTGPDIGNAERMRHDLFHRARVFFEQYDVLLLPVSPVAPFDASLEYPVSVAGQKTEDYLDWLRSSYYISTLGNPAASVPSGFTSEGLPLGLQIVGPYNADYDVLRVAYAYEQATQFGKKRPTDILSKK